MNLLLPQVQAAATGLAAALMLALLSATLEGVISRRAHGLRRRKGGLMCTALLADGVKLLARTPGPRPLRRTMAALAVLLPGALLAGGLPAGGGLGTLAPTIPVMSRFVGLAGVLAVVPLVLLLFSFLVVPERRQPLTSVLLPLLGAPLALILSLAAVAPSHDADSSLWTRGLPAWPLWQHPTGALAVLGAQVLLARSLRIALGGPGPGRLAPGLAEGGGAGTVLLQLSRPLLIGASSALAAHMYLGIAPGPPALVWAVAGLWIMLVVLLQTALTETDAPGLARLLQYRILPLAGVDVAVSLLRALNLLPWT